MNAGRFVKFGLVLIVVCIGVLLAASFVAAQGDAEVSAEQEEANRATLMRVINEGVAVGDLDMVAEALAEDYVVHSPLGDLDRDGVISFFSTLLSSFSEVENTRDEVIVEGNLAAARSTFRGVFSNEFPSPMGMIPPNGQVVELVFINIFRFNDEGLIEEEWVQSDLLGFFTQLGAFPAPAN
jgi:predicted SnoaL-like aldol condensation-catalyzing enzyme